MATTPRGTALTEEHRIAQIGIVAAFLREFLPTWDLLDFDRLDDTTPGWLRASKRLIRIYRQRSAERAERYFREFRLVEAPAKVRPAAPAPITYLHAHDDDTVPVRLGEERPVTLGDEAPVRIDWTRADRAAERSLLVTGPSELKRRTANHETEAQARRNGLVAVTGSASRQVLTGGREAVLELVQADKAAIGYIRVTDGDPCAFCAMLASRGPVYKKDSFDASDPRFTGPGQFKVHDSCACTLETVYSDRTLWPGRAREFAILYRDHAKGRQDQLNAFRRAYDKSRREAAGGAQELIA